MVSAQNWASIEFKSCCPKPCVADNWNLPGQRFHHLSEPLFQCLTMTLGKFLLMFLMISAWSLLFLPPHSSLIFHTVWLDLSCPQSVSQICGHTLVPSWLFLACLVYFVWGFKLFHNNMVQEYQRGEKIDSECSSFRVSWEEVSALFPQAGCTLRLWKLHD